MCMAYPDYPLIILDRSWRWLRRNLCPSLDWIHPPPPATEGYVEIGRLPSTAGSTADAADGFGR